MYEFQDNDKYIITPEEEVQVDQVTNIPKISGQISRGFDPNFQERYLLWYKKLASDPLEAVREIRDDPVKFVEYCCRTMSRDKQTGKITILCFELYEEQKQAIYDLRECWLNGDPAVFFKSRQQGASWLCDCFAFWVAIFYQHQAILCTSKSDDDLHEIGNLKSFMEKFVFLYRNLHPYVRKQIIYKFEHKRFFFQINDSTIEGGTGKDPARGGTYTLSFHDEFAANENASDVLSSIGPCCNANIFVSTLKNKGDEYDKLIDSPAMKKIKLNWRNDPQIIDKEKYKADFIAKYGQLRFNVEIDCRYAETDELMVFDKNLLDKLKLLKPMDIPNGDIIAGFDVSGLGSDSNVLIIRQGHSLLYKDKWEKCFAFESVDRITKAFEQIPFSILMFDEIGVGYAIASEFARRINVIPYLVQGIHFNSEAGEKGVEDGLLGEEERQVFFNLRSKLHFNLAERIENTISGHKFIDQSDMIYINDEEIIKEMYHIPQDEKSIKKMKVASKPDIRKRLGYSPNHVDALLLTYTADQYIQQYEIESHLYGRVQGY